MKKTLKIILTVIMLVACIFMAKNTYALTGNMAIISSNAEVTKGTEFTVEVSMSNIQDSSVGVIAFGGTLVYDENVLTFVSIEGAGEWEKPSYNSDETGLILVSTRNLPTTADETICKITFKVNDTVAAGNTDIVLKDIMISDGTPFEVTSIQTAVTIKDSTENQGNNEENNNNENENENNNNQENTENKNSENENQDNDSNQNNNQVENNDSSSNSENQNNNEEINNNEQTENQENNNQNTVNNNSETENNENQNTINNETSNTLSTEGTTETTETNDIINNINNTNDTSTSTQNSSSSNTIKKVVTLPQTGENDYIWIIGGIACMIASIYFFIRMRVNKKR